MTKRSTAKKSFGLICGLICLQFFVINNVLFSQNWTGNLNSDWNNSANWTAWPLNNSNITIDTLFFTGNKSTPIIASASLFSPRKILLQNGANLKVLNDLTTTDNIDVFDSGTLLTIESGNINVGVSTNGRILADFGASVLINNGTIILGKSLAAGIDALITMNNGNVNALQRLLVDQGGKFVFNDGNIVVGQRFAISGGNVNRSSIFEVNGGILQVGTEVNFVNEFGQYYPSLNITSGTLNINGNVNWLGVAPGSGTPRFNISGGTTNISGNIQNITPSTVKMYMQLTDSGKLNFTGGIIENQFATDSIIQTSNNQFFINSNCSWINNGVYNASSSLININGNTILQGLGKYNFSAVLINNAKTMNHIAPMKISIDGNFTNNGIFISNQNTVDFSGKNPQVIDGNNITQFNKVYITNSSLQGVTVQKSIDITGQ